MQIAQIDSSQSAATAAANAGTFSPATILLGLVTLIPLFGLGLLIWLRSKKNPVNDLEGKLTLAFYKETNKAYSLSLVGFVFLIISVCSFLFLDINMYYESVVPTSDFSLGTLIFMGYIVLVYPLALLALFLSWVYKNKDSHKAFQLARLIITFIFLTAAVLPFFFLEQV